MIDRRQNGHNNTQPQSATQLLDALLRDALEQAARRLGARDPAGIAQIMLDELEDDAYLQDVALAILADPEAVLHELRHLVLPPR